MPKLHKINNNYLLVTLAFIGGLFLTIGFAQKLFLDDLFP